MKMIKENDQCIFFFSCFFFIGSGSLARVTPLLAACDTFFALFYVSDTNSPWMVVGYAAPKNRRVESFRQWGTEPVVRVVVVLTLSRINNSVVTGQAPVTLEWSKTPGKKHETNRYTLVADAIHASARSI